MFLCKEGYVYLVLPEGSIYLHPDFVEPFLTQLLIPFISERDKFLLCSRRSPMVPCDLLSICKAIILFNEDTISDKAA